MGFYADKRVLMDGAILLYRRRTTDGTVHSTWQARFKLAGKSGYSAILSCKTANYEQAVIVATDRFHELHYKAKNNLPLKDWTFKDHWVNWFERQTLREHRARLHRHFFNRYFAEYFGDKRLGEITAEFAEGYWSWRRAFWSNHKTLVRYNPKRLGAKTRTTTNAKANPSNKTLAMERQALNQIFQDACKRQRMPLLVLDKLYKGSSEKSRWGFDEEEWPDLELHVADWASGKDPLTGKRARLNGYGLRRRRQVFCYVMFMVTSGLRPGEARQMRWEDIAIKDNHVQIRVRANTKTGRRTVISMSAAITYLELWRKWTLHAGPQDYVWQGQGKDKNTQSDSFNKTFQNLLQQIPYQNRPEGLLLDPDGEARVIYSLRHTYATQRLLHGEMDIHALARNMGTSVQYIERHYSHVTNIQNAAKLTSDKRSLEERTKGAFPDSSRIADGKNVEEVRGLFELSEPKWVTAAKAKGLTLKDMVVEKTVKE